MVINFPQPFLNGIFYYFTKIFKLLWLFLSVHSENDLKKVDMIFGSIVCEKIIRQVK